MNLKQKGGKDSTNIQAESVNISTGLSVVDVKEIAQTIFDLNFPKLYKMAKDEVNRRNIIFQEELSKKLEKLPDKLINKFSDPDIQYNLLEVQKKNARYNSTELRENLISLLIKRLENDDTDIKKIVINEAIETVDKLNLNQIKILTFIFLTAFAQFVGIKTMEELKKVFLSKVGFLEGIENSRTDIQHLVYCGCVNHIPISEWSIYDRFRSFYPEIFKGKTNEQVSKIISENDNGKMLIETHKKTRIKNLDLTSVGIVLSIMLSEKKIDKVNFDVGIWIK